MESSESRILSTTLPEPPLDGSRPYLKDNAINPFAITDQPSASSQRPQKTPAACGTERWYQPRCVLCWPAKSYCPNTSLLPICHLEGIRPWDQNIGYIPKIHVNRWDQETPSRRRLSGCMAEPSLDPLSQNDEALPSRYTMKLGCLLYKIAIINGLDGCNNVGGQGIWCGQVNTCCIQWGY